jgi:hypothetical protein
MGLDITAYGNLQAVRPATSKDLVEGKYYEEKLIYLYTNPEFPETRYEPLAKDMLYSYEKEHNFRAGSYSGYNDWRRELAKLIGTTPEQMWKNPKPGPFSELINFSDCEGVIGPTVAAKLHKDFLEWDEKARNLDKTDPWFYDRYRNWMEAMGIASDRGAVVFH